MSSKGTRPRGGSKGVQSHRSRFAAAKRNTASNSLSVIIKQARKSGVLNLSNQEFDVIPDSVWNLNNPPDDESRDTLAFGSGDNWWEQTELRKLYLSSNKLQSLSENINRFPALQLMDLQDNRLTSLPVCIAELENLENFNISHNQLSSLDFVFTNADKLSVLMIMHNKITQICSKFFQNLISLQQLNLSHNLLNSLPESIQSLANLRQLNLSNNSLTTLPDEMGFLQSLTVLDLSNNSIKVLPDNINKLIKLEQLYLRNNRLESFPKFSACTALKELSLANNQLKSVPHDLPKCLAILELRENKITSLNNEILKIEMLERLDLANNDLSQIDPQISIMPNLKVITLDGNPIKSIRRDVINRGSAAILKFLQTRIPNSDDINSSQDQPTSALPQSRAIQSLSKNHEIAASKKLSLKDTDESKVQDELSQAADVDLIDIAFSKCKLVDVPLSLSNYKQSLTKLCLSHNRISKFPMVICELVGLTHLDLSCNLIESVPDEFENLQSLMEINIVTNRFVKLPDSLYRIPTMEHILADENQITCIDVDGLKSLSALSTLSLKNNNINNVPPELGNLEQIKNLTIDGNLFRVPRQAILRKGTVAILEYLRSRIVQ